MIYPKKYIMPTLDFKSIFELFLILNPVITYYIINYIFQFGT